MPYSKVAATLWICSIASLAGCAAPLPQQLPNGTLDQVAAMPKRQATATEEQAVLKVLKDSAKVPASVELKDVWVDDTGKQVIGFCGQARGNDDAGRLMPFTGVTGVLTTSEGSTKATDVRLGRQAIQLCQRTKYPMALK